MWCRIWHKQKELEKEKKRKSQTGWQEEGKKDYEEKEENEVDKVANAALIHGKGKHETRAAWVSEPTREHWVSPGLFASGMMD